MESTPFSTIESAEEFMDLLHEEIERTTEEIEALFEGEAGEAERREEALRLVVFKLKKLSRHTDASRRLLRDLKSLRTLLLR